jgi:Protein of unknown function (DUF4236)
MPLRFYRRFRVGLFRMNLSRRVSYGFGGRGLWLTVGPRHSRTSAGLPGTGLYWYQQRRFPPPANDDAPLLPRPHRSDWLAVIGIVPVILTTLTLIWR